MGGKLPSLDMLLSEMVIPMQNSYYHNDYPKACIGLYGLGMFLQGFNQGLSDFPIPPKKKSGVGVHLKERDGLSMRYIIECKDYYDNNYPIVMQRLGLYQKTVLESIEQSQWATGGGFSDGQS